MASWLRSLLRLGIGLGLGFEMRNKFIHKVLRSKLFNPTTTLMEKKEIWVGEYRQASGLSLQYVDFSLDKCRKLNLKGLLGNEWFTVH